MPRVASSLACVAAAAGLAASAAADTVPIISVPESSTENLGTFTGFITYDHVAGSIGNLLISLTNTTPAAIGGYITAFVFNINSSDPAASAEFLSGPANFSGYTNVNAQPFGMNFDAGASTSTGPAQAAFEGGGAPQRGLGVGETGEFTFRITAEDAAQLSAADFIEGGPYPFNFVVRFRGMTEDGSDKVPGVIIPLPAPAALAGAAIFGLALHRRRPV